MSLRASIVTHGLLLGAALAQGATTSQGVTVDRALLAGLSSDSKLALLKLANPPSHEDTKKERRRLVRRLLEDPAALAGLELVLDRELARVERRYAELLDAPVREAYLAHLQSLSDAQLRQVARTRRVWRDYILRPSTQLHFQQHFLMPATKVAELLLPDVATITTKDSQAQLKKLHELAGYREEVRLARGLGADPTTGKVAPTGVPMPPLTQPRSYEEHLGHLHKTIAIASTAAPREARRLLLDNADRARRIDKEEAEFVLYSNEVRALMGIVAWSTDVLACAATRDHSKDRVDGNASGHMSTLPGKRGFTDRVRRFGTSASSEGAGGGSNGRNYLYQLSYGGGHTGPLYSMKRNRVGVGRHGNCYTSVYAGQKDLMHPCQASTGELFMPPGIGLEDVTDKSLQDIYHALLFENWGGALRAVKEAKATSKLDRFMRRWFAAAIEVEADWHLECAARFAAVGDLDAVAKMIGRTRDSFGDALDKRLRPLQRRLGTNAGAAALAAGRAYAAACAKKDDAALKAFAAEHARTVYAQAARHHLQNGGVGQGHRLDWFLQQDRYLARFGYLTLD